MQYLSLLSLDVKRIKGHFFDYSDFAKGTIRNCMITGQNQYQGEKMQLIFTRHGAAEYLSSSGEEG